MFKCKLLAFLLLPSLVSCVSNNAASRTLKSVNGDGEIVAESSAEPKYVYIWVSNAYSGHMNEHEKHQLLIINEKNEKQRSK